MKIFTKTSNQKQANKTMIHWLRQLFCRQKSSSPLVYALLLVGLCFSVCFVHRVSANEAPEISSRDIGIEASDSKNIPANHKIETEDEPKKMKVNSRQSRQYDGPLSTSGTGSYGSISGDGATYLSQLPLAGSTFGSALSSAASQYAGDLGAGYHSGGSYHDMGRGYGGSIPPMHHNGAGGYPGGPMTGISSLFPSTFGSGLLSSSMFPLMTKGFDLSEIVCTAIAVAIGAVIIGAPFILIYLFVMNQMNGNGPGGAGPSGGAISLTGPTSSTTVNGRKKRHTTLSEALFKQLSPLVNSEQVASTFKALMSSIAKYQM